MSTKRRYRTVHESANGKQLQIQSLVDTLGEFRQEMGTEIGKLSTGLQALKTSFDEFKARVEPKINAHETLLQQTTGSRNTLKWIFGSIGIGSLIDGLYHVVQFFKHP